MFVNVISTGGVKGRRSLREHRKQNTQRTSCWVAVPFHLFIQPICLCACVCDCLWACEGGSSQEGWSVWVEETLHIPELSFPPPLAVPPNFLLWLGLWGAGVQQEGCFPSCPLRVLFGEKFSPNYTSRERGSIGCVVRNLHTQTLLIQFMFFFRVKKQDPWLREETGLYIQAMLEAWFQMNNNKELYYYELY